MADVIRIAAPKGLGSIGKKLWRETTSKYVMRQDELEVLKAACSEADLIDRMEDALKDAPLTVEGSQGQLVAHPLVQELRQHRATMAGLLGRLKLPDEESESKTNQHRSAAQSKWSAAHGKTA